MWGSFREEIKASGGYFPAAYTLLTLCFVPLAFLLIESVDTPRGVQPDLAPWFWLLFLLIFGAIACWVLGHKAQVRYLQAKQLAYLERINYEDRLLPEQSDDAPESRDSRSLKRRQHDWYQGHRELNWTDRKRAESYGVDVDEYLSNFPHD